jgi:hypothetical protein
MSPLSIVAVAATAVASVALIRRRYRRELELVVSDLEAHRLIARRHCVPVENALEGTEHSCEVCGTVWVAGDLDVLIEEHELGLASLITQEWSIAGHVELDDEDTDEEDEEADEDADY